MAAPFKITPEIEANVKNVTARTKLEGNDEAAYALVEYGSIASKAYAHLKKTAGILRQAFGQADDMTSRHGQALVRNLVFQGFSEEDREAYSKFIPSKSKENRESKIDDGYDADRVAKIRIQKTLSRHVNTITDYCFPPVKAVTGAKRARTEKEGTEKEGSYLLFFLITAFTFFHFFIFHIFFFYRWR